MFISAVSGSARTTTADAKQGHKERINPSDYERTRADNYYVLVLNSKLLYPETRHTYQSLKLQSLEIFCFFSVCCLKFVMGFFFFTAGSGSTSSSSSSEPSSDDSSLPLPLLVSSDELS